MSSLPIVVIKVGGSLLDWPELPARLKAWLAALEPCRPVLICGGGMLADSIRILDRLHRLGETAAHALALHTLDTTGHVLHQLMPELTRVVVSIDELEPAWRDSLVPILLPRLVLDRDDHLPHCWDVTTDAIAGRIASLLGASRVVLLKSAPAPADMRSAVNLGLVDPWFDRARGTIAAEYVDLRSVLPSAFPPFPRGD